MLKNKIIVLVALFFGLNIGAQEIKFRKVSKEELSETSYAKDSSAVAAYLYKHRSSYYEYYSGVGLKLITEIHERIKIYDKNGFDYATKTINLSKNGGSEEKVGALKGYSYSLDNGKIVETKLEKESIFKSEHSKNLNKVKITMPNIKEGSVIDYKYKITSPFIQSIDEFRFQEDIPIKKVSAKMKILEYFKFKKRQKGFLFVQPKISQQKSSNLDINVVITEYNLTDVPALKSEKYVTNIDNYRSSVDFEIVSLEIPGNTYESFSKSWDDVVNTIYESSSFGGELKKKKYFEEELEKEISTISDPKKRVELILNFVKNKVKWNKYRGVYCDEGVKKAYKNSVGNSGDINLMLVAMLKHAGIKAYPVILSTRDNGIPLFPTLEGFNYVIAAVKIGEQVILLDGTDPYSTLDVLPVRTLNWYGRMISETGKSTVLELMPSKKAVDMTMMEVEINEDGSVKGTCKQRYTNHYAMLFREKYNKSDEESFLEKLEKDNQDVEISNYELKYNKDLMKPVVQSYDWYREDSVEEVGGKLYISPLLYLATMENPFKSDKREFPVDYGFSWTDTFMVNIKIPEGYKADIVPVPTFIALPDGMGVF